MPARVDALVLDLDTRAGLCIARTLGRGGLSVDVASRDLRASGLRTRYAGRRIGLPDPETGFDAYCDALVAALREAPADATLATIDASVEALHRRRADLERWTAPALGAPEAVEVALHKERTLEVARGLGIPVPRSLQAETVDDVAAAAAEVGYPCVVKPVTSWRGLGDGGERVAALYAAGPEEARVAAAALARAGAPVLVQELAPGRRETIKLFRVAGAFHARVAMVVDRAWPPLGGSSVMRHTITPPDDVLAHAERLVSEIGLDGYSETEFRRAADGRPLLMEVNARLSQSVELAVRAGVDFPRLQLEWARGGRLPEARSAAVGLRVGWAAGELRLLAAAALGAGPAPRPRLGAAARELAGDYLVRRARLEGLDGRDPRPVLAALAFTVRSALPGSR